MIYQLIVMFGLSLIGKIISHLLPFPFPGTIIASIILFLLLEFKVLKLEKINTVATMSKKYLALVFIPVGVEIMQYFNQFSPMVWVKIIIVIIISTALTMLVTGKVSDLVIGIQDKLSSNKNLSKEEK